MIPNYQRPAVVDGSVLIVPVTREVQRVIERWTNDHYDDLVERLKATPGFPDDGLMIVVPTYERYVTEAELKP